MLRTGVAMLAAILVAFIIILFISDQPAKSIRIFLLEPLSSKRYLGNIVETMTPLVFSGLAMAVLFQTQLFNLGGEGVFFMSGIAGSMLAIWLKLPPVIFPLACKIRRERDGNVSDDEQYFLWHRLLHPEQYYAGYLGFLAGILQVPFGSPPPCDFARYAGTPWHCDRGAVRGIHICVPVSDKERA